MEMLKDEEGIKVFNAFMSVNNLHIYGLQPSTKRTVLEYIEQTVPESVQGIRPFKAGQKIPWTARPKNE
jgi:dihydroorotase